MFVTCCLAFLLVLIRVLVFQVTGVGCCYVGLQNPYLKFCHYCTVYVLAWFVFESDIFLVTLLMSFLLISYWSDILVLH